jgi:hypothetical protein
MADGDAETVAGGFGALAFGALLPHATASRAITVNAAILILGTKRESSIVSAAANPA